MINQAYEFKLEGKPIYCERYGSGHINETYLLIDEYAREYILQKINKSIFKNTEMLMKNISAVTEHLNRKVTEGKVLTLVPTKKGENFLIDESGEYWRLYEFVCDSVCLNKAESADDFKESAFAFGLFQKMLADFPAETLFETIPDFHNTPKRFQAFHEALKADICDRAAGVKAEIEFALANENYASTLMDLQNANKIPLRVTHNDTKLNNVLLDRKTRKAVCVIDLDTVMPGLSVNDFGDSIRFGASTASEDEKDLSKVNLDLEYFEAYTNGFLSACGKDLNKEEISHLPDGAKMMTLECGVRFLTDYLSGDTYFRIHYPEHNLDRCRTQFKLVQEMDKNWDKMQAIVKKYS